MSRSQLSGATPARGRAEGIVAIRTVGLTKVFSARKAVDSVNLEIRTGEVFGFLGPNGAGKTTTINILLGLLRPTFGYVEILGQRVGWTCAAARRQIGSLLDGVRFYPYLTARENLRVLATALGGAPGRRIDETLDMVGLTGRAGERVARYSHGMRRRLALALALVLDPMILVLDEPASGLDPTGIREMRDLMRTLAASGKAVFLSSHLLHEVEIICDRVAILRQGIVLAQGRVDELLKRAPAVVFAVDRPEEAERVLRAQSAVRAVRREGELVVVEYGDCEEAYSAAAGRLCAALVAHGVSVREVRPQRAGLESVFFEVLSEVSLDGSPCGRVV